jgi:hypothetical protein
MAGTHPPWEPSRQENKKAAPASCGAHPMTTLSYKMRCNRELNFGRRSTCGTTDSAADTQQVDVPAHDEHGVRNNTHLSRITYFRMVCPVEVGHVGVNLGWSPAIPAAAVTAVTTAEGHFHRHERTVSSPHRPGAPTRGHGRRGPADSHAAHITKPAGSDGSLPAGTACVGLC